MNGRLIGLLLVVCSTVIEAVGQMFLKHFASGEGDALKKRSMLGIGIGCLAVEAGVWTQVMRLLPVSIAYPMGSLSFVAVTVISLLVLNETVAKERWIGVSLIIFGTALLSFDF